MGTRGQRKPMVDSSPAVWPHAAGRTPQGDAPRLCRHRVFYGNYDLSLLNTSLKHIAESLLVDETDLGYFVARIRFAGLLAFVFIPVADLIGRRHLFGQVRFFL